jgi:hypothetical protein
MNGDSYRLKQSRRKRPHLPNADSTPERASGEKGRFRYAPAPLLPRILNNLTANYWPTFIPPRWSGFTPPLTPRSSSRRNPFSRDVESPNFMRDALRSRSVSAAREDDTERLEEAISPQSACTGSCWRYHAERLQ